MSHEKVKGISLKDNKVYLNSADSSLHPLYFTRWECKSLSKIYAEQGKEAVLAELGKEVWNGNFHLYKGSKLCNLFIEARSTLPRHLNWSTYDSKTAGEFLAKMVMELEKDPNADLSPHVNEMLGKMIDREYILDAARRTGHNYLNYASPELQNDRDLVLEIVKAGGGCAWFSYPSQFSSDKEIATEALKFNGCHFRNLDISLQEDKDIIRLAFTEELPNRNFHEHLPDLIPPSILKDKAFMIELLSICPSLHVYRTSHLLQDKDFALQFARVGKSLPYNVDYIPKEFLRTDEFKDVLLQRFCNDETKYAKLTEKYISLGLEPPGVKRKSLSDIIHSAEAKAESSKHQVSPSQDRDNNISDMDR